MLDWPCAALMLDAPSKLARDEILSVGDEVAHGISGPLTLVRIIRPPSSSRIKPQQAADDSDDPPLAACAYVPVLIASVFR